MCVELNKALCKAAEENLAGNEVTNVKVVACDSAKYALKLLKHKGPQFQREYSKLPLLPPTLTKKNDEQSDALESKIRGEFVTYRPLLSTCAESRDSTQEIDVSAGCAADLAQTTYRTAAICTTATETTNIPCDMIATQQQQQSDSDFDFSFSTVLVDPPRAGVDGYTLKLIAQYHYIIYISCNPDSLIRDLHHVSKMR
jgi:tRNA/tmRNA/rRNA uracil-C5-methylase (TrmA/RlmC/RlmD family)